jgi:hypothetical protein
MNQDSKREFIHKLILAYLSALYPYCRLTILAILCIRLPVEQIMKLLNV